MPFLLQSLESCFVLLLHRVWKPPRLPQPPVYFICLMIFTKHVLSVCCSGRVHFYKGDTYWARQVRARMCKYFSVVELSFRIHLILEPPLRKRVVAVCVCCINASANTLPNRRSNTRLRCATKKPTFLQIAAPV